VPNPVYVEAIQYFSEEELIDLTMVVAAINTWNQLNISFPKTAGTYKVAN